MRRPASPHGPGKPLGNESWNRADLDETSQNPANPLLSNISPIRNWRALEVFLYLWWQHAPINPLYEQGIERIGCMVCPAMLESEYEILRTLHPGETTRWDAFLDRWAGKKGSLLKSSGAWGLWRWKALPPKMRVSAGAWGIPFNEDFTLKTVPGSRKPGGEGREKHHETRRREKGSRILRR